MNFRRQIVCSTFLVLTLTVGYHSAWAIDINPSKQTVPDMSQNHNRFDIFAGDPARIQKANAINFAEIQAAVEVSPSELSLYSMNEEGLKPNLRVAFRVKDIGTKRTYTLCFPNAQRYEILVISPDNKILYKWSADKIFVESVGTTMINPGDSLCYNELLPVSDFYAPLSPGLYTVAVTLANYPEVTAKCQLKVVPGQPVDATPSSSTPPSSGNSMEPATTTEAQKTDSSSPLPKP